MKVYMDEFESYIYGMYASDGEKICIEIEEELYNEYQKLEEKCVEMQDKLNPLMSEYNIKMGEARKERKIQQLEKEIEDLRSNK